MYAHIAISTVGIYNFYFISIVTEVGITAMTTFYQLAYEAESVWMYSQLHISLFESKLIYYLRCNTRWNIYFFIYLFIYFYI